LGQFLRNTLLVICGPTAVGKTALSIQIAKVFNSEIISADSRQFYRELKIGAATPSPEELATVKHHFIGHLSVIDYYNISRFEQDVLHWLKHWFRNHSLAIMTGGSGLYISAVCSGIDELPDPDHELREALKEKLKNEGIDSLRQQLSLLDPDYFLSVDQNNPNRILRALEVCLLTEKPYSILRKNKPKSREFRILKIGLNMPRSDLNQRIDRRVDRMIEQGLVTETRNLIQFRKTNALNTVGYKEILKHLDGVWDLQTAVEKIKVNTHRYAKRQLTWFRKDAAIQWFHPDEVGKIVEYIRNFL
jgi:tRNA dimethylallyltransferase